jgi:hypothetical protein
MASTPRKAKRTDETMSVTSVMLRTARYPGLGIAISVIAVGSPVNLLATMTTIETNARSPSVSNDFVITSEEKILHIPRMEITVRTNIQTIKSPAAIFCIIVFRDPP